ncbi:MAG: hypothetical protein PVI90_17225 [Desulfobacteraceae bacterium]|jgi:hypothetical protein
MKSFIKLIVCVFVLGGCASSPMLKTAQPPDFTPDQNAAQLVIIDDTYASKKLVFQNYLDGKFIGETSGKTYFVTSVTPGKHYVVSTYNGQVPQGKHYSVSVAENAGVTQLNFEAGKSYFLRRNVSMTPWRTAISGFHPITLEEAQKAVNNCTYLGLNSAKKSPDMSSTKYQAAIDKYQVSIKDSPDDYQNLMNYKGE